MRIRENANARWLTRVLVSAVLVVAVVYSVGWLIAVGCGPYMQIGRSIECRRNLHIMSRACAMYADDYEGRFPRSQSWTDGLTPFVGDKYRRCPSASDGHGKSYGYAMHADMGSRDRARVERPETEVLLYDSTVLTANVTDRMTSLPVPGRHVTRVQRGGPLRPGNWVAYVDGSARIALDEPKRP